MNEQDYIQGSNMAYRNMMLTCIKHLSNSNEDALIKRIAILISERAAAVAMLRIVCEDFGDNDWPDNLHLSDIIEKHLQRNLYYEKSMMDALPKPLADNGFGRTLLQTLTAVKKYMEEVEEKIDSEWGGNRSFKELQEADMVPDVYLDVLSFIINGEGRK